jgi:hypothetical protein
MRSLSILRAATALALLLPLAAAAAPTLTRGPYLQSGTDSRVVVRWRTDEPSDSRVAFGTSPSTLDRVASSAGAFVEHAVELDGLLPETVYHYSVGSSAQPLAGGVASFRTPPAPESGRQVRFWALGDVGTGDAVAASVRAGFASWNQGRPVDGILALGDNAYTNGTDAEYQAKFFAPLASWLRGHYLWPVYGNHDAMSSQASNESGPYFVAFDPPRAGEAGGRPSGTEAYYSFDVGDVHVVVLDSSESPLRSNAEMAEWLTLDLAANLRPWTIVLAHHPPYTHGSHDSDDPNDSGARMQKMRENIVPILDEAGVELVLTGHSHGYERSMLVDGHYGTSDTFDPAAMALDTGDGDPQGDGAYLKAPGPRGGIVHVVSGSAGKLSTLMREHPIMVRSQAELGSFALEIEGGVLRAFFVRPDGSVGDTFEIVHPGGGSPDTLFADGFEGGLCGDWDGCTE